jgi:hypothetical protein
MENMILIMVDECGDEVEVARYTLSGLLDEDEIVIWQNRKIEKASEEYPEARGFYFEDRRDWNRRIALDLAYDMYGYDPDEDEDIEWLER